MIDSGIRSTHEDLRDNLWVNPDEIPGNLIDDDNNGIIDDVHGADFIEFTAASDDPNGHGTHCAGIIGAQGNNNIGMAGVCWDVQLMDVRFLNALGYGTNSGSIRAVRYAIDEGADVINASWGSKQRSSALEWELNRAAEQGIIVVVAAGNESRDTDFQPIYPACYESPTLISVAAIDSGDVLSFFSNYGRSSVDLAAPGSAIHSASNRSDQAYVSLSGTSMAAPFVTGIAAMLKAHHPNDSSAVTIHRMLNGAEQVGTLANTTRSGRRANLVGSLQASSLPPNDDFIHAQVLAGYLASWNGAGENGTRESAEPVFPDASLESSLWFKWEAAASQPVELKFRGMRPVSLELFSGDTLESLSSNGAIISPDGSEREASFPVVKGQTYYIRLASSARSGSAMWLNLQQSPLNDDFINAAIVTGGSFSATGSTSLATGEPGEPLHAGQNPDGSIWYSWTAPSDGLFSIDTFGSKFDTVLGIYQGDAVGELVHVAENDDSDRSTLQSLASFSAIAGQTYYIAVDGYGASNGPVQIKGSFLDDIRIVNQPHSLSVLEGDYAEFSVQVIGSDPKRYQWFHNGEPIVLANTSLLRFTEVEPSDVGNYHVEISNQNGTVSSDIVRLEILKKAPRVVVQPRDIDSVIGVSATLSAVFTGDAPISYQWFKNGTAIAGATETSYRIETLASGDAGEYQLQASNSEGTIKTRQARIRLTNNPWGEWRWRHPLPISLDLAKVIFAENQFVAVGESGTVMLSPDGENWDFHPTEAHYWIDNIRYDNGKYLAWGRSESIIHSTDAKTWTSVIVGTQIFSETIRDVSYGDGCWIARSYGHLYRSYDGENWEHIKEVRVDHLEYGNGLWLALSGDTTYLSSDDGDTWEIYFPLNHFGSDYGKLKFRNGKFIFYERDSLWTSSDGINWSQADSEHRPNALTLLDGKIFSMFYTIVSWSEDGLDWNSTEMPGADMRSIAYGNGRYVVVGYEGYTAYGDDPLSLRSPPKAFSRSPSRFLEAEGRLTAYSTNTVATSGDGVNWSEASDIRLSQPLNILVETDQGFIGIPTYGYGGGHFRGFTPRTLSFNAQDLSNFRYVAHGNGHTLAIDSAGKLWRSADTYTWVDTGIVPNFRDLQFHNGSFIGLTSHGISTSSDGLQWNEVTINESQYFETLVVGADRILVASKGSHNHWYSSSDGVQWTRLQKKPADSYTLLTAVEERFLAVVSGDLYFSSDLQTWYEMPILSSNIGVSELVGFKGTLLGIGPGLIQCGTPESAAPICNISRPNGFSTQEPFTEQMIEVEAWDPEGELTGLEIYIDGQLFTRMDEPPFSTVYLPTSVDKTTIEAIATDASGFSTADSISISYSTTNARKLYGSNYASGPYDIIVLNDIYYAVGAGRLERSFNGIDWEPLPMQVTGTVKYIEWDGERLIAATSEGDFYVSTDGYSFEHLSSNFLTTAFATTSFGFVAVNRGEAMVWNRDEGFSTSLIDSDIGIQRIVSGGPGQIIGIHRHGDLYFSADGLSWHDISETLPANFSDVIYFRDRFIAVGEGIWESEDGLNWTEIDVPEAISGGYDISLVGERLFVGHSTSNTSSHARLAGTSTDGYDWIPIEANSEEIGSDGPTYDEIGFSSGVYVTAARFGIWRSTDGINWTEVNPNEVINSYPMRVVGGPEGFVIALPNNIRLHSTDGEVWTELVPDGVGSFYPSGIFFGPDGKAIAIASKDVFYSPEGDSWDKVLTLMDNVYGATYGDGRFIVVGNKGQIADSLDGRNWNVQTASKADAYVPNFQDVIYANGVFIACGDRGSVFRSTDGQNWTESQVNIVNHSSVLLRLAWGGGRFIITTRGVVYTSTDGLVWDAHPTLNNISKQFWKVLYDGGAWIGVADSSVYRGTEADGWTEVATFGGDLRDIDRNSEGYLVTSIGNPNYFLQLDENFMLLSADQTVSTGASVWEDEVYVYGTGYLSKLVYDDLGLSHLQVQPGTYGVGEAIEGTVQLRNNGDKTLTFTEGARLLVELTRNRFIDDSDDVLSGVIDLSGSIAPGEVVEISLDTVISLEQPAGAFFLYVRLEWPDGPFEITKANNYALTPERVLKIPQWHLDLLVQGQGDVKLNKRQANYAHATSLSLVPVPEKGHVFTGWSGDMDGGVGQLQLVMDQDRQVTAQFSPLYVVSVSKKGKGQVLTSNDSGELPEGSEMLLRAVAEEGWQFVGWSSPTLDENEEIVFVVTEDAGAVAHFVPDRSAWNQVHFTASELLNDALSSPSADPDRDGRDNDNEFAFGTNPRKNDQVSLQIVTSGSKPGLRFPLNPHVFADGVEVLGTADLEAAWSPIPAEPQLIGFRDEYPVYEVLLPEQTKLFIKLDVNLP